MKKYCYCLIIATLAFATTNGIARAKEEKKQEKKPETTQETAKVIEVKGSVEYAPVGTEPLDTEAWKPVEKDMRLVSDTQIRTGLRSRCVLMFGEEPDQTVISIRRATLASISDFRRSKDEQRIRIGLGYGAVRGGSSEGTLRSDVIVDSTVATLAKRGTEGFQIEVEPVSGRYRISLARHGLVEAFSKATGEKRLVRQGEYSTRENIARMWVTQDIFDRAVQFFETGSLTEADLEFMSRNTSGATIMNPEGAQSTVLLDRPLDSITRLEAILNEGDVFPCIPTVIIDHGPVSRPEGNFGFGPTFRIRVPQDSAHRLPASLLKDRSDRIIKRNSRRHR